MVHGLSTIYTLTHRVLWRESVPRGHPNGLVLVDYGVVAQVVRRERAVVGSKLKFACSRFELRGYVTIPIPTKKWNQTNLNQVTRFLATHNGDSDSGRSRESDAEFSHVALRVSLLSLAAGVSELTPLVGVRAVHAEGSVVVGDEARPLASRPLILSQLLHRCRVLGVPVIHELEQKKEYSTVFKVARWQNLIPSFPWIAPGEKRWGKEGIKFCSVAKRSHSPEAQRAKHIQS